MLFYVYSDNRAMHVMYWEHKDMSIIMGVLMQMVDRGALIGNNKIIIVTV